VRKQDLTVVYWRFKGKRNFLFHKRALPIKGNVYWLNSTNRSSFRSYTPEIAARFGIIKSPWPAQNAQQSIWSV
jgi:hypothetical protein